MVWQTQPWQNLSWYDHVQWRYSVLNTMHIKTLIIHQHYFNENQYWLNNYLQLFQSFPTEVTQNDSEWPILPPIHNYFNLFPLKWLRMTRISQFCLICNFSSLLPLKWLRLTRNGQFCPICNFSILFPLKWQAGQNESQKHCATIETSKNFNISADSQPICTELSEQHLFFQAGWNEFKKC